MELSLETSRPRAGYARISVRSLRRTGARNCTACTDLFISSDPMLPRNADISDIVTVRRVPFSTAIIFGEQIWKMCFWKPRHSGTCHGGNASEVILFVYCWVAYTITSVSSLMRTCSLRPPRWYQWYGLSKSSFCKDCILGLPSTTEPPNSMSMCAWPNKRARQLLSCSLNIFVLTAELPQLAQCWSEKGCVYLFCLFYRFYLITPPKTNMEPENGPVEKEIPIGNHHFQVPCWISGVYYFQLFPHVFGWFFPCKLQFCSSFES